MEENTIPENNIDDKDEIKSISEPSPAFSDPESNQDEEVVMKDDAEALTTPPKLLENPQADQEKVSGTTRRPISTQEERTWAALAHLSVLLNLFTGFFGILSALIIYIVYKDRSRLVAYHAMQSFILQAITWIGAGILAALFIGFGTALFFLVIPLLCLIPGFIFLLAIPASLIYGIVGAVQVSNGEDFRYWLVGDWAREILEPKTQP